MATSIFKENFPGVARLQQAVDAAVFVIGLDLHQKTTAICVVDRRAPHEPIFQRQRLPNAELATMLQRFPGPKVVVCEAAYGWLLVAAALRDLPGVTFIPFDARKTAHWVASSGVKTDRLDAQVLCYACLTGGTPRLAVWIPELHDRECVRLVRHREQLIQHRVRVRLQLRALARDAGPNPYTGEVPDASDLARFLEVDLRAALETLTTRIACANAELRRLSADDAVVRRLRSIPGIGPITAFALRHKIGTIARFADAAHLASYVGLAVREHQSGDARVKGHIAKAGDALLRRLLVEGAQVVRFRCPELLPLYFPQLGQSALMVDWRHANRVVVALARKQLTFVWHLWTRETSFDLDVYKARRAQVLAVAPPATAGTRPPPLTAELETVLALRGREKV